MSSARARDTAKDANEAEEHNRISTLATTKVNVSLPVFLLPIFRPMIDSDAR